jgi:hypothetical protein
MANHCGHCGTPLPVGNDSDRCWKHGGPVLTEESRICCPFCKELILAEASKCRHCGEFLTTGGVPASSGLSQAQGVESAARKYAEIKRNRKPATGPGDWIARHTIWTFLLGALLIGWVGSAFVQRNNTVTQTESETVSAGTAKASAPPATPEELRQARLLYASEFDQHMIDAGIESKTTVKDSDWSTLQVTYALAGRVTANEFGKEIDFDRLKALGFKKVVLTNGFHGELGQAFEWLVF